MRFLKTITGVSAAIACFWAGSDALAQDTDPLKPQLEFAFEEVVMLGAGVTVGATPMGDRYIVPIAGGTFDGPGDGAGFKGVVVPGGWDWQLKRTDGCVWASADYMLRTTDGAVINVRNQGPMCPGKGADPSAPILTTPVFEAPVGRYQWLNQAAFVGRLDIITYDEKPAVRIRFYRVR